MTSQDDISRTSDTVSEDAPEAHTADGEPAVLTLSGRDVEEDVDASDGVPQSGGPPADVVEDDATTLDEPAPAPEVAVVEDTPALPPPRRRKRGEGDSWFELVKTVFYAVLIAVGIRTVLFQPFNIPSASMEDTLLVGDYLFVSKFSYGYSLYSLPWGYWVRRHVDLPGRIFGSEPNRGDIVVFKYPPDNKTDYIKRLIGLPGDHIQMKDGQLFLNGQPVPKVRVADSVDTDEYGNTHNVPRFKETLPGGVSYYVLDRYPDGGFDNTDVYVVPPGHYFMMGDNRDNSDDSRGHVGMVPFENLVGRARFIWWSIDDSARLFEPWTWPGAIRYDRIATFVD